MRSILGSPFKTIMTTVRIMSKSGSHRSRRIITAKLGRFPKHAETAMGTGHSHGAEIPSAAGRHRKLLCGADVDVHDGRNCRRDLDGQPRSNSRCRPYGDRRRRLGPCITRDLFRSTASNPAETYGYLRTENPAALVNAVILLLLTIYMLYEAYQRFRSPPEVLGGCWPSPPSGWW